MGRKNVSSDDATVKLAKTAALLAKQRVRFGEAAASELAAIESHLGPLPDELRAWFTYFNGPLPSDDGASTRDYAAFGDWRPMTAVESLQEWLWKNAPGADIARPWKRTWIPLMTNGIDSLVYALDGGALVSWWHEAGSPTVEHESLDAWATTCAKEARASTAAAKKSNDLHFTAANRAALEAIHQDPENIALVRRYADWLRERGDAYSEVIELGVRQLEATRARRRAEADELYAAYEKLAKRFRKRFAAWGISEPHEQECGFPLHISSLRFGRLLQEDELWLLAPTLSEVRADDRTLDEVSWRALAQTRSFANVRKVTIEHPAALAAFLEQPNVRDVAIRFCDLWDFESALHGEHVTEEVAREAFARAAAAIAPLDLRHVERITLWEVPRPILDALDQNTTFAPKERVMY